MMQLVDKKTNCATRNKSIVPWRTMHTGRILPHKRPLCMWS